MTSSNDRERSRLEADIEALLFASDTPLSVSRLSALTGGSTPKEVRETVQALERFYRDTDRSFSVVEVAGGYQVTTLPAFAGTVSAMFKSRRKPKLSQAALETLAIIAYRQPISRLDIESIRGVNCDGVLATLTERDLIAISGRGEGLGRPYLYSTTATFLEYLGLKDYRDLPAMEELERSLEALDLIPPPAHEQTEASADDEAPPGTGDDGETG
jgi:segregation and condensation protein B